MNGTTTPLLADRAPLHRRFRAAVRGDGSGLDRLATAVPLDERDAVLSLLAVNELHTLDIDLLDGAERFQHHPAVVALKVRLDERFLAAVAARDAADPWDLPSDAAAAMRTIGHRDAVPEVYRWLADEATAEEMIAFLALEGGPDGGFDDLVAACQIGLRGAPKLELAQNYWDEMGNGHLADVHTELHHALSRALDLPPTAAVDLPLEALERAALASVLATNRRLQPELVGALGLLELQAGPRCRKVVAALRRIDAPADALRFYEEHATVDPRHGKDWLDKAVTPLAQDPRWAEGIVRGARWRSLLNASFFAAAHGRFVRVQALAS